MHTTLRPSFTVFSILSLCVLASCGKPAPAKTVSLSELQTQAAAGSTDAMFELGALYHEGQTGLAKDNAKSLEYFRMAAAKGEVRSQFNIGVMYYSGDGVKQSYAEARKYFELAAAQGDPRATFNLGVMYHRGEGVTPDLPKALAYFRTSAEKGFGESQFNLGVMLAKGEGTEADIAQAYAWFAAAKKNGSLNAEEAMKNIERALSPTDLKTVRAAAVELEAKLKEMMKASSVSSLSSSTKP